jgi:hypothetical protein
MGGAITLAVGIGHSTSQTSEIDAYETAVRSQSKTEALSFIKNFGSSHLVGDLIESLPTEVAQQVCTDLQGSAPARARQACESVRQAFAAQPDAQIAEIAPAAGGPVIVDPMPAGTDASEGVHSQEEAQDVQDGSDMDGTGGTDRSAVRSTRNSAQLEPVSTSADTSTAVPSGLEPQADKDEPGVSNSVDDADLFYLPVAMVAPAGDIAPVAPVSTASVVATTSPPLADEPGGGQGTSDTDKSDGANVFLRVTRTAPAARTTGASSVSVSTPASTGVPTGDATAESSSTQGASAQTNNIQSGTAESTSDQSDSVKGSSSAQSSKSDQSDNDNGKKGSVKTADTQSNTSQNGAQSTNAESSSGAQSNSDQGNGDQSSSSTQSSSTQSSSSAQSSSGEKDNGKKSSDQSGKGKGGKGGKGKGGKGKGGKGKGGKD